MNSCSIFTIYFLLLSAQYDNVCESAAVATPSTKARRLVYTNLSYVIDPETTNTTAYIERGEFNIFITTNRIIESVIFEMDLYVKTDEQQSFTNFRKKTIDFCQYLTNPSSSLFLTIVMQHMLRNKNNKIVRECPVKKVYHTIHFGYQ